MKLVNLFNLVVAGLVILKSRGGAISHRTGLATAQRKKKGGAAEYSLTLLNHCRFSWTLGSGVTKAPSEALARKLLRRRTLLVAQL